MSAHTEPIDLGATPPEAVVQFGGPEPHPRRPRRSVAGFGQALASDRRAVPLTAALAAVAAFASLVSEWQVTTMDRNVFGGALGDRPVPTEFTDLGALGAGYLAGLFVLAAAVVLILFGPPAGRHYARLTGLSAAGTLLAVLFALASSLGDQSRTVPRVYIPELESDQLELAYGRGMWCAFAAVLLGLLALGLAGRHLRRAGTPLATGSSTEEPSTPEPPTADPAGSDDASWSWRRPRRGTEDEDREPDTPLELTVGPAKPFTPYADDRDRPNRSGRPGISG